VYRQERWMAGVAQRESVALPLGEMPG